MIRKNLETAIGPLNVVARSLKLSEEYNMSIILHLSALKVARGCE